jgi:glutamate synthase domain-containing protein 1
MPLREREAHTALRQTYGSLLLNGPSSIIISNRHQMIGLTDRIRLRPLVAGRNGDFIYISSEEAPMHLVDDALEETWIPHGGVPVVAELIKPAAEEKADGRALSISGAKPT